MGKKASEKKKFRRYPIVSLGAEHLVIGCLMRRNILAYKAPPNNEGYDIICLHPNPHKVQKGIRIQVKSRYATDSDKAFPVKAHTFKAFDYVVAVFLNIGNFYGGRVRVGYKEPEFYVFPAKWIRKHHKTAKSGWDRVLTQGQKIDQFKNEDGFEQIADDLKVPYPK